MVFEFGPTPTVGVVYSLYFDQTVAKYKVQAGDTTEDVRDGLQAAVNAASWGTTIVTTPLYTNQLQIVITGDTVYPRYQLGEEKFKKGYYVIIDRRAASVGCAVKTGRTSKFSSHLRKSASGKSCPDLRASMMF